MEKTIMIIVGAILLIFLCGWFILRERRKYEQMFEALSACISDMIDHKPLPDMSETLETLPSKTFHQLVRLQEIYEETKRSMSAQQENTQKLISKIAHQLRTPITNIRTYTELMGNKDLTKSEKDQYLQALLESEKRLSFLVESFIKMSRFDNGLITIRMNSENIRETIVQAVFQVSRKAEDKHIEIELTQEQEIRVAHDANWLGEAVANLLDNSVKYSPENSRILLHLTQNEMFTEIAVRDYGSGIEAQEEAEIFTRFYRGKRVTTQEGYGIGLYLSREIVLKHGGFMKVKREHPGLRVSIFLP